MTAPETPPQDLSSTALALATRITSCDIDGHPALEILSPGAWTHRIADRIEDLGKAMIAKAREEFEIDLMDRIGRLVRELVRTEMRQENAPGASKEMCGAVESVFRGLGPTCTEPKGHDGDHVAMDMTLGQEVSRWSTSPLKPAKEEAAPGAWWRMSRRRRSVFLAWLAQQVPTVEGEAPFTHLLASACAALRVDEPTEQELARLRAQVAELQEHARRQHALDGERLRDLQEILDATEAWRGLYEVDRTWVLSFLDRFAGATCRAASRALRALTPDPERARLREELEEARSQQDFPVG